MPPDAESHLAPSIISYQVLSASRRVLHSASCCPPPPDHHTHTSSKPRPSGSNVTKYGQGRHLLSVESSDSRAQIIWSRSRAGRWWFWLTIGVLMILSPDVCRLVVWNAIDRIVTLVLPEDVPCFFLMS
jgi:hypothetical protein